MCREALPEGRKGSGGSPKGREYLPEGWEALQEGRMGLGDTPR